MWSSMVGTRRRGVEAGQRVGTQGDSRKRKEGGRGHACLRAEAASWATLVTEARGRVAVHTAGLGLLAVAVAGRAA